jgi:tRNA nucleotidyltransferase/poly(A) polymerase
MPSAQAFVEDPLRTLRIARLAYELSVAIDPESATAALDQTAPERIFAELNRVALIADWALDGLALMDTLGSRTPCCRS